MKHGTIIEELGSKAVAETLGVSPSLVRYWKCRQIPKARWADFMEAFPSVTLEQLRAGKPVKPRKKYTRRPEGTSDDKRGVERLAGDSIPGSDCAGSKQASRS